MQGEMTLEGEFVWGSNYTFLVDIEYESHSFKGVYKPTRGERPLWDFPSASLAHRETAAYLVDRAMGWNQVPPTVYRKSGPIGAGSLQLFVEHDPDYHYFNFSSQDKERLRSVVLFDLLVNNADRKGSHLIIDPDKKLWLIDHGICFHQEDKLRTVIWDFAGQPVPEDLKRAMGDFYQRMLVDEQLRAELQRHLTNPELEALGSRANWLSRLVNFPSPPEHRRAHPWPPV